MFVSPPWFLELNRWIVFLLWGLWWPAVLVSTMLLGQAWCGLLCPDGMLTEVMGSWSRHAKIPRRLRWHGWIPLGFVATALAVYATGATHSAIGSFLVLGTLSAGALFVGAWFGRGRRVWCRYLCPISTTFGMLARCAPVHFRVDRAAWDSAPRSLQRPIECPVLLDIRNMTGACGCHMCGRCNGYRNAVVLAARRPGDEILQLKDTPELRHEAVLLLFGLFGLMPAVLRASGSWDALVLHLSWQLTLGALLGALIFAAARLADVGAMRLCQTLVPLVGLGLAAMLLKTSLEKINVYAWVYEGVTVAAYLIIAAGLALSGDLARQIIVPPRDRPRYLVALALWWAAAAMGAGAFLYDIV